MGLEEVSITGGNDVGGLAGMIFGSIIANCYVSGNVKGIDQVGGLIGNVCFSKIDNCYTLGTVSGKIYVGGMVGGSTNGQIQNCAALNSNVEAINGLSANRVVGYYAGSRTILDNIALEGMSVWAGGSLQIPINDPYILSDGKGYTASEMAAVRFFENLFVFATPSDDPWTYDAGKLPGFGTAVNMPDYLIQQ